MCAQFHKHSIKQRHAYAQLCESDEESVYACFCLWVLVMNCTTLTLIYLLIVDHNYTNVAWYMISWKQFWLVVPSSESLWPTKCSFALFSAFLSSFLQHQYKAKQRFYSYSPISSVFTLSMCWYLTHMHVESLGSCLCGLFSCWRDNATHARFFFEFTLVCHV